MPGWKEIRQRGSAAEGRKPRRLRCLSGLWPKHAPPRDGVRYSDTCEERLDGWVLVPLAREAHFAGQLPEVHLQRIDVGGDRQRRHEDQARFEAVQVFA